MSCIITPTLRCPFCDSQNLTFYRTEMSIAFNTPDASDTEPIAPVHVFRCGEHHLFFIRSADIQIPKHA
jgi:hypothetical protein